MLLLDNAQEIYLGNQRVNQIWAGFPTTNLIKPSYEIEDRYLSNYGYFQSGGFTIFVPIIDPGVYYYTQYQADGKNAAIIALANENKSYISGTRSGTSSTSTLTKQVSVDTTDYPNAKYIILSWYYNTFEWHMLKFGDSTTTYVPYEMVTRQIFDWKPYKELNWIQTSEATGGWLIDYTPRIKTRMELRLAQTFAENTYSNNSYSVKGILFSAGVQFGGFYYCGTTYNSKQSHFGYSLGDGGLGNTGYVQKYGNNTLMNKGSMYTIKLDPANKKVYVDNEYGTPSYGSTQPTYQLMLGGEKYGITSTSYGFGAQKFGECTIYDTDNTTPIIHLIPVLRKSDNTPCLYDTINNRYYTTTGATPTEYELKY